MSQSTTSIIAEIDRFVLVIHQDRMELYNSGEMIAEHVVPGYGTSIGQFCRDAMASGSLRIGYIDYGEFQVVMPYDQEEGFGYAWNIDWVDGSEWGSVGDLPTNGETITEFEERQRVWLHEMKSSMGDSFIQIGPSAIRRSVSEPRSG